MTPFKTLSSVACPLGLANVDTDQILPARFLKLAKGAGLGDALFRDLRFAGDTEIAAFPLNCQPWRQSQILVARRNFGTGSSREAAVYALAAFGIRAVIAPSFGDIFASNAVKNGLLPAVVDADVAEELIATLTAKPDLVVTVDLESQRIRWGNRDAPLTIDPVWREQLLQGWDDVQVTRSFQSQIDTFKSQDRIARPWARPSRKD